MGGLGMKRRHTLVVVCLVAFTSACPKDAGEPNYVVSGVRLLRFEQPDQGRRPRIVSVAFEISNNGRADPAQCHIVVTSRNGAVVADHFLNMSFTGQERAVDVDFPIRGEGKPAFATVDCTARNAI